MADDMTRKYLKLPGAIARIVAKTFAVCGDDATLGDVEALVRIRDVLEDLEPGILDRVAKERLRKKKRLR